MEEDAKRGSRGQREGRGRGKWEEGGREEQRNRGTEEEGNSNRLSLTGGRKQRERRSPTDVINTVKELNDANMMSEEL